MKTLLALAATGVVTIVAFFIVLGLCNLFVTISLWQLLGVVFIWTIVWSFINGFLDAMIKSAK